MSSRRVKKTSRGTISFEISPDPPWEAVNSAGYTAPAGLMVDVLLLTVRNSELLVLVVERPEGGLALPGGFIGETETAEEAATRKLAEKTGLLGFYIEQLAAFTYPQRDPRGWLPSIGFLAFVPPASDARDGRGAWLPARSAPALAFDHHVILQTALDRVQGKLWWSNIAAGVLAEPFTMAEARSVYEAISGTSYDPSTFSRDLRYTGLIRPTGEKRKTRGPKASLFEFLSHAELMWGEGRRKRLQG